MASEAAAAAAGDRAALAGERSPRSAGCGRGPKGARLTSSLPALTSSPPAPHALWGTCAPSCGESSAFRFLPSATSAESTRVAAAGGGLRCGVTRVARWPGAECQGAERRRSCLCSSSFALSAARAYVRTQVCVLRSFFTQITLINCSICVAICCETRRGRLSSSVMSN